jgi:hypothetical protein
MISKKLICLVLLLATAVWTVGCSPTSIGQNAVVADEMIAARTPEEVVQGFYNWYLRYEGHVLVDCAHRTNTDLSESYVAQLDEMIDRGIRADPILCAQDIPNSVNVGEATISGSRASVPVTTSFGTKLAVDLNLVEGAWFIQNIRCQAP